MELSVEKLICDENSVEIPHELMLSDRASRDPLYNYSVKTSMEFLDTILQHFMKEFIEKHRTGLLK